MHLGRATDVFKGGLAAKVTRRDTLARKLDAPDPIDDIPNQTSDDRRRLMHRVSIKLERFLHCVCCLFYLLGWFLVEKDLYSEK